MKYTITLAMLAAVAAAAAAGAGNNVQTFAGDLGGAAPPVIEDDASDRPFSVNGATFLNKAAALQRSCAVQHNACAAAANGGDADFAVADCDTQGMCSLPSSSSSSSLTHSLTLATFLDLTAR